MKRSLSVAALILSVCPAVFAQNKAVAPALELYLSAGTRASLKTIEAAYAKAPNDPAVAAYYAFLEPNHELAAGAAQKLGGTAPGTAYALLAQAAVDPMGSMTECRDAIRLQPADPDVLTLATIILASATETPVDAAQMKTFLAGQQARFASTTSAYALLAKAYGLTQITKAERGPRSSDLLPTYEAAVKLAPNSPLTVIPMSTALREQSVDRAYEFLKQHAAAAPDSYPIHAAYWKAAYGMPAIQSLKPELFADAKQLTTRSQPTLPEYYDTVNTLNDLDTGFATAFRSDLLQAYPGTELSDVIEVQVALLDTPNTTVEQNRQDKIDALRALLKRPKPLEPAAKDLAVPRLIDLLLEQPQVDPAELFALLQNPPDFGWLGLIRLADSKYRLPDLERMALASVEDQFLHIRDFKKPFRDSGGFVDFWLGDRVNFWLDALGDVFLQEGRLDEAQHAFETSRTLYERDATVNIHLGKLYEMRGDYAKAETYFRGALDMHSLSGGYPAVDALRELYTHQHGNDPKGLEAFMQPILAQETAMRKTGVLQSRERNPRPMPDFDLPLLGGRSISSKSLKGKYVIVNFWATWCGPCRAEHPEFEKFYQQYKNDPQVVVLSIATDSIDTPDSVLDGYMKKYHYTFPVLRGGDYATENHIDSIPLTWFVGPEGKIDFSKLGGTKGLVQEFNWRLEAMRQLNAKADVKKPH